MKPYLLFFFGTFLLPFIPCSAQPTFPANPESAEIISSDIGNFLKAYAALGYGNDSLNVLQEEYFDKGSPGLKEFCNRHSLTAASLLKAIYKYPGNYSGLNDFYNRIIPEMEQEALSDYATLKRLMPTAVFPPAYLLVGDSRGIAQASRQGQLVTVENATGHPEKLSHNIVHELVHFQQAQTMGFQKYSGTYSKPNNMLDLVLREGGAQFIAYVLVRKNLDTYGQYTYLKVHEQELKDRFRKDLQGQDASFWMWDSLDQSEYPKLLGYAMGCRIVKAYYDRATDKEVALNAILTMDDPEDFFKSSGYVQMVK